MPIVRVLSILLYITNKLYSLSDIGKALGMTRGAISNRVARNQELSDSEILKIEEYFNVSLSNFDVANSLQQYTHPKKLSIKGWGRRLQKLRIENDLTINMMVNLVGIKEDRIIDFIDKDKEPSLKELTAVASNFNVSLNYLLYGEE